MIAATILAASLSLSGATQSAGGVKYRGIFINDEDWGLRPWAVRHFGKKEQIGTRAYAEIFPLMKKCGLNLLWPAMHEGGYEFSSRPENFALADKYGITIGTSHCEPMLRNNCYLPREDKNKWSWVSNREFLENYWREGVKRGQGHGVMYTIGMRGIHDGRMPDGRTTAEKRAILEDVFAAQCAMLPDGAPKMFCPYKEVLPIFNSGLNVPRDAVILWTNDNFGYVRRIGGPQYEGYGGGIYWHASYHGSPHGYIHLCTTPPAFMWYELVAKCWNNGVRDVWMLNAGDVFQAEIIIDAFGQFAADPEAWGADAQRRFLNAWCEGFISRSGAGAQGSPENLDSPICEPAALRDRISKHLAEYYNLGFNRKPEHMCVQWTTNLPEVVKTSLLKRYHALLEEDIAIEKELPDKAANDYFRLVGFQARFLAHAGIIHLEGRDKDYARSVIDPLYERWDKLDGGKWAGFWCDTIDEKGGMRQPTMHNRWSSQMQWPWNEPKDPYTTMDRGVARVNYPATAYRAGAPEPEWLEPTKKEPANGGEWTRVEGLGTSGCAMALLPVKPGVGEGAKMEYSVPCSKCPASCSLVIQFLPDFALWPELGLSVDLRVNGGEIVNVKVPGNNANLGEHDKVRNAAVQDNFVRAVLKGIPLKDGDNVIEIIAREPGVVIDRVGVCPDL